MACCPTRTTPNINGGARSGWAGQCSAWHGWAGYGEASLGKGNIDNGLHSTNGGH